MAGREEDDEVEIEAEDGGKGEGRRERGILSHSLCDIFQPSILEVISIFFDVSIECL